jgi:hypothetical protein
LDFNENERAPVKSIETEALQSKYQQDAGLTSLVGRLRVPNA